MKLTINGQQNTVPKAYEAKLLEQLLAEGLKEYGKLAKPWKVMLQTAARGILLFFENAAAEKYGKEVRPMFRPANKHDDPVPLVGKLLGQMLLGGSDRVELFIETDDSTRTASAFSVTIESPGAGGQQMDFDGNIGRGQDDGLEVSRRGLPESLSGDASLSF